MLMTLNMHFDVLRGNFFCEEIRVQLAKWTWQFAIRAVSSLLQYLLLTEGNKKQ